MYILLCAQICVIQSAEKGFLLPWQLCSPPRHAGPVSQHWPGNPYITLTSLPGARKYSTPSFTGFWKMRPSASA